MCLVTRLQNFLQYRHSYSNRIPILYLDNNYNINPKLKVDNGDKKGKLKYKIMEELVTKNKEL
tara:strand:- start:191 stop:379 length:189 start_codon:yes stop_codon:yes gene_type:complete